MNWCFDNFDIFNYNHTAINFINSTLLRIVFKTNDLLKDSNKKFAPLKRNY